MAVRSAIAIVVGADSHLFRIAIGTLGDGAEVELLESSKLVRHADRESRRGVAVDSVLAAAGWASDETGAEWVGVRGCNAKDGGQADEERGVLHCDQDGEEWSLRTK